MIILSASSGTPLYMQIYYQIKNEIDSGELPAGYKLPSTRQLATDLSVGRNTVENAYLQLTVEGYLENKPRSGYIVQKIYKLNTVKYNTYTKLNNTNDSNENANKNNYLYDFQYGSLSPSDFPINLWKKLSNKALNELTIEDFTMYGNKNGVLGLRNEISSYLRRSRGVFCDPAQIIICAGTEQSLSLLSILLKVQFQEIAIEEPGYSVSKEVFEKIGFRIIPIELENDGLNVNELGNSSAKIVYVTPSHQFPNGAVMSISKRHQLLNWANKNNGIIIEDDYDSELRYNSKPIPSISSIDTSSNVIYLGTFSKILSPSLRISYMVLPKRLVHLYNDIYSSHQSSVSVVQQKTLELFMNPENWERHLHKMCASNKKRHDTLIQNIQVKLGDCVIIHGENAGLHVVLESTNGLSEKEMIEKAKQNNVLVYPISRFWYNVKKYSNNMVLLGFGSISESQIIDGISNLSAAWRE